MTTARTQAPTPAAIICGIEHCGSTLLLDMLKAHPRVYARFEVGLLFARSLSFEALSACEPYVSMLCKSHKLSLEELRGVADSPDWKTAYQRLLALCLAKETGPGAAHRDFFIDKTPAYSRIIGQVLARLPGVPVVGLLRDPRAVFASFKKRLLLKHGKLPAAALGDFVKRYAEHMLPLVRAATTHDNVLLVRYEDLVTDPPKWMPAVCRHIGLDYDKALLNPGNSFSPTFNSYGRLHPGKLAEFKAEIAEEEEAVLGHLQRLRWLAYPVEMWLAQTDLARFGEPLPTLPAPLRRALAG